MIWDSFVPKKHQRCTGGSFLTTELFFFVEAGFFQFDQHCVDEHAGGIQSRSLHWFRSLTTMRCSVWNQAQLFNIPCPPMPTSGAANTIFPASFFVPLFSPKFDAVLLWNHQLISTLQIFSVCFSLAVIAPDLPQELDLPRKFTSAPFLTYLGNFHSIQGGGN